MPVGLVLYSAVTVTRARARRTSICTSDTVNRREQRSFTSLCTSIDAITFEKGRCGGCREDIRREVIVVLLHLLHRNLKSPQIRRLLRVFPGLACC